MGLIIKTCCKQQEIESEIRKDFGTGLVEGEPFHLDEESMSKIVETLSPFYTQATREGANAQQQINNANAIPPKVTEIVTEVITPGSATQTTTTGTVGADIGATTNQASDATIKTGTGGVNGEKGAKVELEEDAGINGSASVTTVTTNAQPTTKVTTKTVPDNSVENANTNLSKSLAKIPTIAEAAVSAVNGTQVSGMFLNPANITIQSTTKTVKFNSFDLEGKLNKMFNLGRDSKRNK